MWRELSGNTQRLAALAALAVFWGALLMVAGVEPTLAVALIGLAVVAGAIALEGKRAATAAGPGLRQAWAASAARVGQADRWLTARSRSAGAGAAGAVRIAATRVERVDWAGMRDGARRRTSRTVQAGRQGATAARERVSVGTRRATAAGGAAVAALESKARETREARATRVDERKEALRLNERAAAARQQGQTEEALGLGERALEIFRQLGDRHGEALTLNGLGLTHARSGDEAGALDAYEKAVDLLTELGDRHGAGRVLANLGVLHRSQGHDERAQVYLHDALERLEPGSPEHDRAAQQLRLAL